MSKKRINLIMCILMMGIFLTGCQQKNTDKERENNKKDSFQSIYIEKIDNCNKELELYYTDSSNVKYYSMCINEIILKFSDKEISLKKALANDPTILDTVVRKLTLTDTIMDGGTTIYKDFGYSEVVYSELGNTGFTIIKCNAKQGSVTENLPNNKDYYFGDLNLEYENGYCSKEGRQN